MTVTEIEIDERGRASLKGAGLRPGRYRVTSAGGAATLERVVSYTETELLALRDGQVAAVHEAFANGSLETVTPDDLP